MKTIKDFEEMIKAGENFSFIKQGDGEILCMLGTVGVNCDRHPYSKELGEALTDAYKLFNELENCYVTKWVDSEIEGDYVRSKANADTETFLHNDVTEEKYNFFKTLKESKRKKVYIGPKRLQSVMDFLNIDEYIEIPLVNSFQYKFEVTPEDNAIYLFSAGMPTKVWIAKMIRSNPNITCVDVGSGFDPIFLGPTRTRQMGKEQLMGVYQSLFIYDEE